MRGTVHRLAAAVLAAAVLAPAAGAQVSPFMPAPGLNQNQNAYNAALLGALSRFPSALGFNPYGAATLSGYGGAAASSLSSNPYATEAAMSGGDYGNPYNGPPYGQEAPAAGFLRGTSDVIRAQGDYLKNVQKSRILQTTADEGRLDYRRRLIEEARYERMSVPTTEEVRQAQLAGELNRARHEPPIADVISARSLNDLLHHLSSDPSLIKAEAIPVSDEVLKHINVTGVNPNGASVGLLKDEGNLQWPLSLSTPEFKAPRELLTKTLKNVVQNLKSGETVGTGSINDLKTELATMNNLVSKSELSPTDYIEERNYLDQVGAAVRAVGDKDVANYFNHKFSAKNVAELIEDMRTKGLDFAPAAPGDEGAYRALQQALAAYDYKVSSQQSAAKPAPAATDVKQP